MSNVRELASSAAIAEASCSQGREYPADPGHHATATDSRVKIESVTNSGRRDRVPRAGENLIHDVKIEHGFLRGSAPPKPPRASSHDANTGRSLLPPPSQPQVIYPWRKGSLEIQAHDMVAITQAAHGPGTQSSSGRIPQL